MPTKRRHHIYMIREKDTGRFVGENSRTVGRVFTTRNALANHISRENRYLSRYSTETHEVVAYDLDKETATYSIED